MSAYQAIYYTGESSRGYEAVISLRDNALVISYLSEEGAWPIYVQWELAGIKRLSTAGSLATFQYGSNFPYQSIVTQDTALLALLDRPGNSMQQQYSRLLQGGWPVRAGLAGLFLALVGLFYFFVVPGTAAFMAGQMPQGIEIELGERLYNSIMLEYEEDEALSELANAFAAELNFETDYPIRITVVREGEQNAFALPGGRIVVFDQLLYELESPEAFAALLGHEVAHVKQRHSLKSISRTLSSYLFVSLVLGDLNGVATVLVENADVLARMSYSRSLEQEADEQALEVLYKNQLDPQGLVDLMETLQEGNAGAPIQLLSTHPLTEDRIAFAKAHTDQDQPPAENKVLKKLWKQMKEE